MNVLNRILVTLLLLILLAIVVLLAIIPMETIRTLQTGLQGFRDFLVSVERTSPLLYTLARIAAVLVALLLFGSLLFGELRPHRPRAVRVHTESGSQATVTTDSVARRLSWHLDQLADVISVSPRVTARGKSVDVLLDIETRPEIDVPMKTDEVVNVTREVITERMGLQLGKVDVRIKHAPYQEDTVPA